MRSNGKLNLYNTKFQNVVLIVWTLGFPTELKVCIVVFWVLTIFCKDFGGIPSSSTLKMEAEVYWKLLINFLSDTRSRAKKTPVFIIVGWTSNLSPRLRPMSLKHFVSRKYKLAYNWALEKCVPVNSRQFKCFM